MIALDRGEDAYYISEEEPEIIDYKLTLDDIKLKKGKYPVNDYEVIVHYDKRDEMKLKKKISYKVNDTKLKVVGYFTGSKYKESYLVSNNTIKYNAVTKKENVMIYPKNKEQIVDKYKETLNIKDSYEYSKDLYLLAKKDEVASVIKTSVIFLVISLIEIYLMMRSSFLSRIKEVGIYRAIGVKKKDIYKMFTGEILSITTFASLVGVLLMMYILKEISFIDAISDKFQVDLKVLIVTIAFVYAFNLLVGLLPVYMTIRKTPAQILSRSDI
jgi:ABC-type antimicrobial peptide transport system permease subunit